MIHFADGRIDEQRILAMGERHGYEVIGASAASSGDPRDIALDITSPDQCRAAAETIRPHYLVHLAAVSFVQHADVEAFYRVNVVGTMNLLRALADAGVPLRKAVIASSANVYGNATCGVIDESCPPQPVNHYAASKLAMEHMVRTLDERLPIVITRPFNYTGPGQETQFLIPKIESHFARREPFIELGNLDVERDFSDVRMVVRAYRGLLECDCAGETVNVCSGRAYAVRSIVEMLERIHGFGIEVRTNPALVRQSDVRTLTGSPGKLRSLIGDIEPIPLEETLRWMVRDGRSEDLVRSR